MGGGGSRVLGDPAIALPFLLPWWRGVRGRRGGVCLQGGEGTTTWRHRRETLQHDSKGF